LLLSPPRANLAFIENGQVDAVPVAFRYGENRYWAGLATAFSGLQSETAVHLVIDDGEYHTDLRGIAISGRTARQTAKPSDTEAIVWIEIIPERITAWDYGSMRWKRT